MARPLVTVITRTFNSEKFIRRALGSLLEQTFADRCQFLVIDDGSIDGTHAIVDEMRNERMLFWERGIYSPEERGPMRNLNKGIGRAMTLSPYFMILDHDDVLHDPSCIEKLFAAFSGIPPRLAFAYCDYYDEFLGDMQPNKKKIVVAGEYPRGMWNTVAGGILFRVDAVAQAGFYDEKLMFPEYDLLLKLIARGCTGAYVPEVLWTYLRVPGSMTSKPDYVTKALKQLKDKYGFVPPIREY